MPDVISRGAEWGGSGGKVGRVVRLVGRGGGACGRTWPTSVSMHVSQGGEVGDITSKLSPIEEVWQYNQQVSSF